MVEIILCTTCKGSGYGTKHHYTCYHKGEYDVETYPCPKCKGSGRLLRTTTVKEEPYVATMG